MIQIGDREAETAAITGSVQGALAGSIEQLTIGQVRKLGAAGAARRGIEHLRRRGAKRAWPHIDLDVLADDVMPAVDSPGRHGLDFAPLAELIAKLVARDLVIGPAPAHAREIQQFGRPCGLWETQITYSPDRWIRASSRRG